MNIDMIINHKDELNKLSTIFKLKNIDFNFYMISDMKPTRDNIVNNVDDLILFNKYYPMEYVDLRLNHILFFDFSLTNILIQSTKRVINNYILNYIKKYNIEYEEFEEYNNIELDIKYKQIITDLFISFCYQYINNKEFFNE